MARGVLQAFRARGALAVDPKTLAGETFPERIAAWDEDETTLAIDAASRLPRAEAAVVGPGIDVETFRFSLDAPRVLAAGDPMAVALGMGGRVWAVGCPPGTHSAIAALVADDAPASPPAPQDASGAPRMVPALRALQETRRVQPEGEFPDTPMGAYVPWATWIEDLPARLRLVAQRCAACARVQYPPRGACVACRGRAFEDAPLAGTPRVYAHTRIGRGGAPSEFALEQAQVGAYWVAIVEWPEEKVRVSARLWGFDDAPPAIGDALRPVVRRLFEQEGRVRYGVKFARA